MDKARLRYCVGLTVLLLALPGIAGEAPKKGKPKEPPEKRLQEELSETEHTATIGGEKIQYTAQAGRLLLEKEDGTPRAAVFFVAYVRNGDGAADQRPIAFCFNGGPGAASVWLHLGAFGPRRLRLDEHGKPPPPPYELENNDHSLLDVTDLVFIDPVSTGFSRAAPGEDPKQFHGVQEDIKSVGEFIRLYVSRFGRWGSPKFLIGESYGTVRAAGLAERLQDRRGMHLNGLVLISPALNLKTFRFDPGNDVPYPLFLPAYTAAAWYHKKLPEPLQADRQDALQAAERFAATDYLQALAQGTDLAEAERDRIARELARLTGLSPEYVRQSNLRVSIGRFTKELLRDQRRVVGRFDCRFTGPERDAADDTPRYDPSLAEIQGAFATAMNHYVRTELKFESDLPYEFLAGHRVQPWDYGPFKNRYVNVSGALRQALVKNPHLRVHVASGVYDLATPDFATRYTLRHLGLPGAVGDRLTASRYEAGHMMYIDAKVLPRLKSDLARFIRSATQKGNLPDETNPGAR